MIKKNKKIKYILLVIAIIILFFIACFFIYNIILINKIFYRTKVDNFSISGKNKSESQVLLKKETDAYLLKNLKLIYQNDKWDMKTSNLINQFNNSVTVEKAFLLGRDENIINNLTKRLSMIVKGEKTNTEFEINNDYFSQNMERIKSGINKSLQESSLEINDGQVKINKSSKGLRVNEELLKKQIINQIQNLSNEEIKIPVVEQYSSISEENLENVKEETEKLIAYPITLNYKNIKHQIGSSELGNLIKFETNELDWQKLNEEERQNLDNFLIYIFSPDRKIVDRTEIESTLDQEKTKNYLSKFADNNINIKPKNATLGIKDGSVTVITPEASGQILDINDTSDKIHQALFSNGDKNISVKVIDQEAEVRADNYQELGIKELIGSGHSNFVGSPENRIHNITVGAQKVNGALIKPGESFSLNEQLGEINADSGYLPELVIKENKTVPEYGGGLCQIGTTCFRAALNSSLPILERQNHAYIVSYYAPTGTDATIYPPHPDLIFKNNTNNYILIQTNISGNYLTFDFYGTKGEKNSKFNGLDNLDGATDQIENVNPHVYNQKPDGAAEAEFYRFIFEKGQLAKTERFHSSYDSPNKYPH